MPFPPARCHIYLPTLPTDALQHARYKIDLYAGDDSKWSHISSQLKKKNHNQDQDDTNSHNKKSVLAKVKEKAKKLKNSLRRKKHNDTNESSCPAIRSSGVGPKDKGEEDAEHYSAQVNESKHTPDTNTQPLASTSVEHLDQKLDAKQYKEEHFKIHAPSDPSADADTKNHTEKTMDVPKGHEFPERNSRFSSGLMVSTPESRENKFDRSVEVGENMKSKSQMRDKSVSVKEYLMHKFEPGEDERALSKVITQAISPRRDKVRDAMSSFLKNEESSEVNFKSKSLPASTNIGSKIAPIKQSYSLGSNASKASLSLNQTFKSTFASYQDHFISSSSNHNTTLNYSTASSSTNTKPGSNRTSTHLNSTTKTSSSPLGHAFNDNETRVSADTVSSAKKTRVPSHTATSVRRVPVSRPNQKRQPIRTETNTISTYANENPTPLSSGDQGRFRLYNVEGFSKLTEKKEQKTAPATLK
ncbi:hypothetical protein L1987_29599 [Smallanthus sonchifolius]|uniref:Uncharacterized protein n=1 Tax=Smallanthus sonchifolius TaxID=185202 RepID=A0ACB9I0F5_9ASTR|nr:hypothetical protein L1987_29599 [Smallanthus sonchifolius]